jgi:hypothetical protein
MGKKVFNLHQLKDVQGRDFKGPVRDEEGNMVREKVLDDEGKPIMQIPRNPQGSPIPGCQPEQVYRFKSQALGVDCLPEMLKSLFLNIPADKLTRQDTIYGTRMFQNIRDITNGTLEIDDDVHDWIKEKLKDQNVGIKIFGVDLYVLEQAIDDFERLHEKGGPHGNTSE